MATAPNTPTDVAPDSERRLGLRRARFGGSGGFSAGSLSSTESYRGENAEDPDLSSEVVNRLPALAPPPPDNQNDGDDNRRRLIEAAMAGDASYAREFRLTLLNRLLMRGISLDNIAREMGVSISTVKQDRAELKRRLREAARGLDINELIGGQMAFYDEATAMSMRISSQSQMPVPMRLAGIRTALAAKADQTRFLTSAGVFDVLSFRRSEDNQEVSDVQLLMQRTEEMLNRLVEEGTAEPETPPPPPPRSRVVRRRPGAFSGMSFDDQSASGSSDEVVNL